MSWIFLAVAAQFINAFVAVVDKHIVSHEDKFPKPFVYAFYTCLISGIWILVYLVGFLPFVPDGFHVPSLANIEKPTLEVVALSFLSAYTFFTALVAMFTALRDHDASDVVPVIGSVSALGAFGLGYFFLGSTLAPNFVLGVALLAVGTFLVSRLRFPFSTAMVALYSGLFFALHYVAIKGLFTVTSFDNGFFWSRIAFVFFALTLLMIPNYLERVREGTRIMGLRERALILGNKILAGVSTILILKATDLGDVTVVQALGGLQFVFILLLGLLFARRKDSSAFASECCTHGDVIQKAIFITIMSAGFLVLFV